MGVAVCAKRGILQNNERTANDTNKILSMCLLPRPMPDGSERGGKPLKGRVFSPLLRPEEASENFPGPVS